jgi:ApaG protein
MHKTSLHKPSLLETTMYESTTRNISVRVKSSFVEDDSAPADSYYFWAYTVEIANGGPETVRLRSRFWRITDSLGRTREVRGTGVVGEEPVLEPGDTFRYTSGLPLTTPSGVMLGAYQMENANGETFDVRIPLFSLDSPYEERAVN